jgi:hypothetical protein
MEQPQFRIAQLAFELGERRVPVGKIDGMASFHPVDGLFVPIRNVFYVIANRIP